MAEAKKTPTCNRGKFIIDNRCLNLCQVCLELAPDNLDEKEGTIVVSKQPESEEEEQQLNEAMRICPNEAIKKVKLSNGDNK